MLAKLLADEAKEGAWHRYILAALLIVCTFNIQCTSDESNRQVAKCNAGKAKGGALEMCKALLEEFRVEASMYQMGKTRLFFRAGVLGHLEDTWARIQRCPCSRKSYKWSVLHEDITSSACLMCLCCSRCCQQFRLPQFTSANE